MSFKLRLPGGAAPAGSGIRDACVCTALRMLSRYASRQLDRLLAGQGLTLTQFQLMLTLREEGPARVVALARRLRLDSGPTGRSLEQLENQGIVSRPQRWRFSEWALHPDGVAHLEVLEPIWHDLNRSLRSELGAALAGALVRAADGLPAWVPCEAGWLD